MLGSGSRRKINVFTLLYTSPRPFRKHMTLSDSLRSRMTLESLQEHLLLHVQTSMGRKESSSSHKILDSV